MRAHANNEPGEGLGGHCVLRAPSPTSFASAHHSRCFASASLSKNGVRRTPMTLSREGRGKIRSSTMPTWRRKPPNDHDFNKRSTAAQRTALADTAQIATAKLYADVLWFWRQCQQKNANGTGAAPARSWHACAATCRAWRRITMKPRGPGSCSAAARAFRPPIGSSTRCGASRRRCGFGER